MILRPASGANEARTAARRNTGRTRLRDIDRGLALTLLLLLATGLVTLYAASYYNAQDAGSPFLEVRSQLTGVGVGLAGMAALLRVDYRALQKRWVCGGLLAASLVLLALVAVPGVGRMLNGSRRWLKLGPVSFQPSELAKYSVILYLARALSRRDRDVTRFWQGLVPLFLPLPHPHNHSYLI